MKVIDASIAVKWFIEEQGSDQARAILTQIQDEPQNFAVPDLFFIEMLNFLSRLEKKTSQLQTYLTDLEDLGISRIQLGHELLMCAAELSARYMLSGYDAIYAATASLLGGTWVTADEKAHRKVSSLRLSELLSSSS